MKNNTLLRCFAASLMISHCQLVSATLIHVYFEKKTFSDVSYTVSNEHNAITPDTYSASLNRKGYCTIEIDADSPRLVSINSNIWGIVQPDDTLSVYIRENMNQYEVKGTHPGNLGWNAFVKEFTNLPVADSLFENPVQYKTWLQQHYNKLDEQFADFCIVSPVSAAAATVYRQEIKYHYLNSLLRIINNRWSKASLPADYFNEYEPGIFGNAALLQYSNIYKTVLSNYYYEVKNNIQPDITSTAYLNDIFANAAAGTLRAEAEYLQCYTALIFLQINHNDQRFTALCDSVNNHIASKTYRDMLEKATGHVAAVHQYSDIQLNDQTAHEASLSQVLDTHKGKLLIVDFWATWCGPCIKEMPALQHIADTYKDAVSVLALSVDNDFTKWKDFLSKHPADNFAQYVINPGSQQQLLETFSLGTYPRYMIFSDKGELINVNAPNPSSGKLEALLNDMLAKSSAIQSRDSLKAAAVLMTSLAHLKYYLP